MYRALAIAGAVASLAAAQLLPPPSWKALEGFVAYAGPAFNYTSVNAAMDECPFGDEDAYVAARAVGKRGDCAGERGGLGLRDSFFTDRNDPGVVSQCLEVPAGSRAELAATLRAHGAVAELSAPAVPALLAAATAAQQTAHCTLLLAQEGGYPAGTNLTPTRADALGYAPVLGSPGAPGARVTGTLVSCPSTEAQVALEAALEGAFGSDSALCQTRCAGDGAKRCGCRSTPAVRCMGSKVDYVAYASAANESDYYVAYRLRARST